MKLKGHVPNIISVFQVYQVLLVAVKIHSVKIIAGSANILIVFLLFFSFFLSRNTKAFCGCSLSHVNTFCFAAFGFGAVDRKKQDI